MKERAPMVAIAMLLFIAIMEGMLLWVMAQQLNFRHERIRLLKDHKSLCGKYIKLSEHSIRKEKHLQIGYAKLVQGLLDRLGIAGIVPGIDEEIARATIVTRKKNILGHEVKVQSEVRRLQLGIDSAKRSGTGGPSPR